MYELVDALNTVVRAIDRQTEAINYQTMVIAEAAMSDASPNLSRDAINHYDQCHPSPTPAPCGMADRIASRA